MTVDELLETLESRSLLPPDVLGTIRQQVSRSIKIVTPDSLAKLLVGKGLLTPFQAEQLLASAKPTEGKSAAAKAVDDLDDEMTLAPLDDEKLSKPPRPAQPPPPAKPAAQPAAAKPAVVQPTAVRPVATKPAAVQPQPAAVAKATTTIAAALPKLAIKPKPTVKPKPTSANAPVAKRAAQPDPLALPASAGSLDDLLGDPLFDNLPSGDPLLGNAPLGNSILDNPLLAEPLAAPKANALRTARRKKKGVPAWIWFAIGGVAVLVAVVIAVSILTRSNGDAEWKLAEKEYQAGHDPEASQKLSAFLDAFPQHPQASLARVYLGMARLRQAFAAKTDWDGQLTAARQVLPALVAEPEFNQVREALAKMLPDMAAGLAQQAQSFSGRLDLRREKVVQAREGLTLAEDWRFVPDKFKPWPALQATSDQVAQLSREIDRGLDVEKALTAVRSAIAAGNGADAYGVRDKLLQSYPELRQGSELDAVNQELLHAAPQLVKIDPQSRAAETKPRTTPIVATFADVVCRGFLQDKSSGQELAGLPVADPKSPSLAVLASGSVYWLQANNGAPLGRQFVGLDSVPPVAILPVETGRNNAASGEIAGATDWVVFDSVHKELLCFTAGGTELRWRQTTGGSIDGAPLPVGRRLYVATRSGQLAMIDTDSGQWIRAAQFPEPLRAAPGVSADGKTLYVAGDHGVLYFVSAGDLSCTAAVDLGYGSGSVRLAPLVLGAYIVIVETPDWNGSELRVVSMGAADAAPRVVQTIALPGQVASVPVVDGKQLMLATDKGVVMAFEASGSGAFPLIKSMQKQATGVTDALPRTQVGRTNLLIHRSEASGVWVEAMNGDNKRQWEAIMASPTVGEPMLDADGTSLRLVYPSAAAVVSCPLAELHGDRVAAVQLADAAPLNERDENAIRHGGSVKAPYKHCAGVVTLPSGDLAAAMEDESSAADHSASLVFSTAKDATFRPSPWTERVCSSPVAFGKGLLIANSVGQICWIDVASGKSLAAAFQPRLAPGEQLAWRKPALVHDKLEAIVSDGGTHLYRVGVDEKPSAHLIALAETTLARPVVSDVAINGDLAFVVDAADNLTAVNIADLKSAKNLPLGGPIAWGPRVVNDTLLVATSRELLAIDSRADIVWRVSFGFGVPVGTPLQAGDDFLFATADGFVERIDRKTGQLRTKVDLEQPLAAGPIAYGKNLALVGLDGSILAVPRP